MSNSITLVDVNDPNFVDFTIPSPPQTDVEACLPLDDAIDIAATHLGLPLLGGPSGRGWSFYSVAQLCPHLFKQTYERGDGTERGNPAEPLQIGGMYHALQAYFYAGGLGETWAQDRGLCRSEFADAKTATGRKRQPKPGDAQLVKIPPTAADDLLALLKRMAEGKEDKLLGGDGVNEPKRPSINFILIAEKAFDAHTAEWGSREDMTPLAIEWLARHPLTGYTCRYDAIMRLGPNDPLVIAHSYDKEPTLFKEGGVVVMERKTAAWLGEAAIDGWTLDGEILGEIMCWKASGCEKKFGPLAGVIIDIVSKGKKTDFHRMEIPVAPGNVKLHEKWLRWTDGQVQLWRATGAFPKHFNSCWGRYGRCPEWHACVSG